MKKAYCFGHISTGKLYRIQNDYPEPNGYGEIVEVLDNFCGEALSSSLVLSRLGVEATLEGNWIGDNDAGRNTVEFIRNNKIHAPSLFVKEGYEGVNEIVISDSTSRTVFGRYVDLLFTTRQWDMPNIKSILASGVIACDPGFMDVAIQMVLLAQEYNIPFVGIDAEYSSWYTAKSSVIILSEDFLARRYPNVNHKELFELYCENTNGLIIFTFGSNPIWYGRKEINKMLVIEVPVLETAGAGDAFRAGIMYGVLHQMTDKAMVQFASAVASVVIQTAPGVVNFEGIESVNKILMK